MWVLLWIFSVSRGLSQTSVAPQFVSIIDGGSLERLPQQLSVGWETWVLEKGKFLRVPTVGDSDHVNAVSFDELWLAHDLPPPRARLALGVHVRDGTLRHLMPAIDTVVARGDASYRNRGLCTVPRARAWLRFGKGLRVDALRLAAFVDDDPVIDELFVATHLSDAVSALATDPPSSLDRGSHIVHVVTDVQLPTPENATTLRVALADFSPRIQDLDAGDSGLLEVKVSIAAPGGTSDFLPECYRPLFAPHDDDDDDDDERMIQQNGPGERGDLLR